MLITDGRGHFFDSGVTTFTVEPDGAFRCVTCGRRWYPRRRGDMSPYHQDLRCPSGCPPSPDGAILLPPPQG